MQMVIDPANAQSTAQRVAWTVGIVVFAAFVLAVMTPLAWRAYQAPAYVQSPGEIVEMSAQSGVRYTYVVDGVAHAGTRVMLFPSMGRYGVSLWESRERAYRSARGRFVEGAEVTVWHHPGDATRSALDVEVAPVSRWSLMLAPIVVAVVGVGLVMRVWRGKGWGG